MNDKKCVSSFKLLKSYKIGVQDWYILIDADTLIMTRKEYCKEMWKNKGWYTLTLNKNYKYKRIDEFNFNLLMIQKQIVTISN